MPKDLQGDLVSHLNPIRVRIKGEGNLVTTVFNTGEDAAEEVSAMLADAVLSPITSRSVNVLANFYGEKIFIDIRTTELDEWFSVSNMWAYVKQSTASYPQP